MVDRIEIATVLNEKQATVMFPTVRPDGETDMNSAFFSEDPLFHEWCLDFFKYSWYNSKSFDEMPKKTKDYVVRRLHEVLTGQDKSPEFSHLSAADRTAILEILKETKNPLLE